MTVSEVRNIVRSIVDGSDLAFREIHWQTRQFRRIEDLTHDSGATGRSAFREVGPYLFSFGVLELIRR